jgi:hypothetical protein
MLCFLTDTPFEIGTTVGIYNNNEFIDTINTLKTYKIKHKMNKELNLFNDYKFLSSFLKIPLFITNANI